MFFRLLLLFTAIPLVELALLVEIGRLVGLATTVGMVLVTGVLGAWLARGQGVRVLARLQADLQSGRVPTDALLEGLMILIAGAVLLTPGLLTDLLGFALLSPVCRRLVQRTVTRYLKRRFASGAEPDVIIVQPHDD